MKIQNKVPLITFLFILVFFLINKSNAQTAHEKFLSAQGIRSGKTKPQTVFNPTLKTNGNGLFLNNSKSLSAIDGTDVRILPSANPQSEVHISIDKTNPNNVIASANTYNNITSTYQQGHYITNNAGELWYGSDDFPGVSSTIGVAGDPSTAFDVNGNFFMSTMKLPSYDNFLIQKSADKGITWLSTPVNGNAQTTYGSFDKEMIASDNMPNSPYVNNIYCTWLDFNGPNWETKFNRSIDGGTSFLSSIPLKSTYWGYGQGANVQTGPNGEVYVCWADYVGSFPATGIGFVKSVDGGVSFTPASVAFPCSGIMMSNAGDPLFNYTRVNDFPAMAVDKSCWSTRGRIYITYPEKQGGIGKSIIQVRYSDDQGNTWSSAKTVSISNATQSWFPWIAVDDATGIINVIYYAFDNIGSPAETNTYVAFSSDGGSSYTNIKVSDVPHTTAPIPGPFNDGYAGDYIGITAYGGKAYAAWMDNRNVTWQIYVSPVTYNSPVLYSSDNNIEVNGPSGISSGQIVTYQATNDIIVTANNTNFQVFSGASVTMIAGNEITFNDKFIVEGEFYAYIDNISLCTNAYNKFVNNNEEINDNPYDNTISSKNKEKNETFTPFIYPNPTNGVFTISKQGNNDEEWKVEIMNLLGDNVFNSSYKNVLAKIDISSYPKGVYVVKVKTIEDETFVGKIVIQ